MKLLNQTTLLRWIIPISLGMGILSYLIVKSIVMQVTHDESYTVEILASQPIWDLISYKSSYTNNHILNTLMVKALFFVFNSTSHSLARVPNILAFVVYFYYVFRFSQRYVKDNWQSLMFVAVMVGNPYLLDFFALIRGYGLSIGLMMASVYFAARFLLGSHAKSVKISLLLSIFSVYAQFATLHFYLGLNLLIGLYLLNDYLKNKDIKTLISGIGQQILGFALLAFMNYMPIKAILRDNQIAYYGKDGFWQNTMGSILSNSVYAQGYFSNNTDAVFKQLTLIVFFILTAYIAYTIGGKMLAQREKEYPSVFATLLFVSTALSVILQFHLLGNQYVVDRTALFFYPLFAMLLPIVALFFSQIKKGIGVFVAVLLIVFSTYHTLRSRSIKHYREWWYDTHTYEVLDMMKQEYDKREPKQPIKITTNWLFCPSFTYHKANGRLDYLAPIVYHSQVDTTQVYDFYYTTRDEAPVLQSRYESVKEWDGGQWILMKLKSKN
jgi:hypothetical protein